jgi:hypothetical protein
LIGSSRMPSPSMNDSALKVPLGNCAKASAVRRSV